MNANKLVLNKILQMHKMLTQSYIIVQHMIDSTSQNRSDNFLFYP